MLSESDGYAQSKLALTMWSFYLDKEEKGVSVVAVNPGSFLDTKMVREAFGQSRAPAARGADILLRLIDEASLPENNRYFDNDLGDWGRAHPDAYDDEKVLKLIDSTELGLKSMGYEVGVM